MISSIKSQSMALLSSIGDEVSSWGIVKASACQRGTTNGAIGVLSSLGGPGTGRIGSGRTRSWPGDETDPSRCVRGERGLTRTSGEPGDSHCGGGASGKIKPGRVGRTVGGGVSGGDHAGGGDLGRGWPASTALYGTSGCSVGAGGWGRGRDLPRGKPDGLKRTKRAWGAIAIRASQPHGRQSDSRDCQDGVIKTYAGGGDGGCDVGGVEQHVGDDIFGKEEE